MPCTLMFLNILIPLIHRTVPRYTEVSCASLIWTELVFRKPLCQWATPHSLSVIDMFASVLFLFFCRCCDVFTTVVSLCRIGLLHKTAFDQHCQSLNSFLNRANSVCSFFLISFIFFGGRGAGIVLSRLLVSFFSFTTVIQSSSSRTNSYRDIFFDHV